MRRVNRRNRETLRWRLMATISPPPALHLIERAYTLCCIAGRCQNFYAGNTNFPYRNVLIRHNPPTGHYSPVESSLSSIFEKHQRLRAAPLKCLGIGCVMRKCHLPCRAAPKKPGSSQLFTMLLSQSAVDSRGRPLPVARPVSKRLARSDAFGATRSIGRPLVIILSSIHPVLHHTQTRRHLLYGLYLMAHECPRPLRGPVWLEQIETVMTSSRFRP